MTILDLTHPLAPDMPVFPGAEAPDIRTVRTIAQDGWAEKWIGLSSHHGTHIDAPAHMLEGAPTLDRLGAGQFVGPGWVVPIPGLPGGEIGVALLEAHAGAINASQFVLFATGWSAHWGRKAYFTGFPVLSLEAAHWMGRRGLKGVGFDTLSADPVDAAPCIRHLALFRAGLVLVENLTGLEAPIGRRFLFSCLPLSLDQADGSPVRAVAMLD